MKKIIKTFSILILSLLFLFTSCAKEKTKYNLYFCIDGEVLASVEVEEGSEIVYPEIIPTKEGNKEYSYVFKEWVSENEITNIYQNEVFEAKFDRVKNQYSIKFVNYDDTLLDEQVLDYGRNPQEPSITPIKESDENNKYYFEGWDKKIERVTGDAVYKACYREKEIKHFTTLKGVKISILGDSISTFYSPTSPVNSYYHEDGQYYYPKYCGSINTYEKTWWGQLYLNNEMILGVNNSWSGSTAYGTNSSAGMNDARINTLIENGDPDIIIVFLGANDAATTYTNQWNVDTYRVAIETIIKKINKISDADIFFIETWGKQGYKDGEYIEKAKEFNIALREVATKFDCNIIPISEYINASNENSYYNDNLHFSAGGATLLSKVCEKYIKEFYGIAYNGDLK